MSNIALSYIPASLDKKKYQSWSPALLNLSQQAMFRISGNKTIPIILSE